MNSGRLLPWHQGWRREVSRTELHDDYVLVLPKAGVSWRSTETELSKHMRDHLCPQAASVRRTIDVRIGEDGEGRPRFDRRTERCWVLPPLVDSRKAFDTLMTQPIAWDDVEDAGEEPPNSKLEF